MSQLRSRADQFELLTFDCYGTLIDWEAGIRSCLEGIGVPVRQLSEVVEAYVRTEAAVEQQAYRPYREVQATTLALLARDFDFRVAEGDQHALSAQLPAWRPFADTNAALQRLRRRYRLGILSNIDRDLLAGTRAHFQVEFDEIVTAEDVRAYKPAHPHFLSAIQKLGDRARMLHVAQSLYHDGVPAAELGLNYVWINRYGGKNTQAVPSIAEFADLASLADALEL
jgi:2-haloacid dehalogenase